MEPQCLPIWASPYPCWPSSLPLCWRGSSRGVCQLRVAISLLSWLLLGGLLFVLLQQRQQFDPYIQRAMQILNLQDQSVVGDTVRIRMAPDGHFWARVT